MPVIRSLAAALARQQALVVLDNCEHLLDPVADLCGRFWRWPMMHDCRHRADLTRLALQTGLV